MPPSLRSREKNIQSSPIKLPTRTSGRNIRPWSQPPLDVEAPSVASRKRRLPNRASSADNTGKRNHPTSIRVARYNERSEIQQPLSVVIEDAVNPPVDVANDSISQDAASHSGISSSSGITNAELEELQRNSQITTDLLGNLGQDASYVLDLLTPKNLTEANCAIIGGEVSKPDSRTGRILKNFSESFEPFAGGLNLWIRPESVLRAFLNLKSIRDIQPVERSAENIMLLANLAELMKDIFRMGELNRQTMLQTIDNTFPRPFFASLTDGSSTLVEVTFDAALSIRTQLAIALLRRGLADPDNQLQAVFLDQEKPNSVKFWSVAGFEDGGGRMLLNFEKQIERRMKKIRTSFRPPTVDMEDYVDIQKLEADFPWSLFLLDMSQWARTRGDEILAHVAAKGGIAQIVSDLKSNIQLLGQSEAVFDLSTTEKAKRLSYMRKTKELFGPGIVPKPSQSKELGQVPAAQLPLKPIELDDYLPQIEDNDQQNPENETERGANQTKRSIQDRQANASRVTFDESQELRSIEEPVASREQRSREGSAFDATPDTGFQQQQPTNADQRRAEIGAALPGRRSESPRKKRPSPETSQTQSKRPRRRRDEDEDYAAPERHVRNRQKTSDTERGDGGNGLGYEEDDEIPPGTYSKANVESKRMTNLRNRNKEPQKRIPWSSEEWKYFEYLIVRYGPSYAMIKDHDEHNNKIFHLRDQVALKDKARNMKFDYLKSGVPLPSGFEHVVMKKSQRDQLRDRYGVTEEEDLDEE